jgi:hypothetical protein
MMMIPKHKAKHEAVADLHKHDGGAPMKHNYEAVADMHSMDGGMPMQHYHEEVAKLCGGGMPKGRK